MSIDETVLAVERRCRAARVRCAWSCASIGIAVLTMVSGSGAALAADGVVTTSAETVRSYFRNPDITDARLSPDGRRVAMTFASDDSRTFLGVVDLGESPVTLKAVAKFAGADIQSFAWVNDERLVFDTIDQLEPLNDQRRLSGLYSIDVDGSHLKPLINASLLPVSQTGTHITSRLLSGYHRLYGTLPGGVDDVIVLEYRWSETGQLLAVNPKRLDVVTGAVVPMATGAPPHALRWLFDGTGEPRVAVTTDQGWTDVHWREPGQDRWRSIARYRSTTPTLQPVLADEQGHLFVTVVGPGHTAVFSRFDFATGRAEPRALVSAPGFDVYARPLLDRASGRLVGIDFDTDGHTAVWFDPAYQRLQAMVDARFPGRVNELSCSRCDGDSVVLVHSYSDRDPGDYFLYRAATHAWSSLGAARAAMVPARQARLDFHRTRARDGEDLPVWVTTPAAAKASDAPRAAVVLVHGGPWVRGTRWRWNADTQFLASHDYVVLEPEFRGSTGFGGAHLHKSFKQWGLAMQDDVADAVQWAVARGLVDPHRVCIMGASYGGYATLMGLVRHPDLYRCGVAYLAVTDTRLMFERSWSNDLQEEAQQYSMPEMIGDPVTDAALLKDASPIEHAKDIRAPLLMAFGGNDRRVPLVHGTQMRDALTAAGRTPEFVVYDGEGHGFLKVENRVDFWTRVERFLARNLQ